MKKLHRLRLFTLAGAVALLSSCGGGSGGSTSTGAVTTPPPDVVPAPPTSFTLTGTAATGRPLAGATVTVFDRNGAPAGTSTVALDGAYSVAVPASSAAPLVLEATLDAVTLVSAAAETKDARVNITPLTTVIAARLAPAGVPTNLKQDPASVTVANLEARTAELKTALRPLLDAMGVDIDPMSGAFVGNGTGQDRLLDALDVQILPAGVESNIEITVRGSAAGINTVFTSSSPAIAPLPAVDSSTLASDNVNAMVDDLLRRWTACYALPLSTRVTGATATTTAIVGTPADVIAPECRSLFLNDDPASYLSNGSRVGRDAAGNGSFSGLFRANATGAVFDQGNFEYLRSNAEKDVVFSHRTTGANAADSSFETLVARNVNGTLKFVGNQYIYNARVRPAWEDRDFILQPEANYVNTGYDLFVANLLDANGNPVFTKVVFTSPSGQVVTLRPNGGRGGLLVQKPDGTLSGSSILYLAAKFKSPATAGNPASFDTGLVYASPQLTDAQLQAIPSMGTWLVEFFHADTSRPNVVQAYRTISRAPTIAEAMQKPVAQFTPAARTEFLARTNARFGVALFSATPSATAPSVFDLGGREGVDFWTVPAGASAPTTVQIFGFGPDPDGAGPLPRVPFDDAAGGITPSSRRTTVTCSQLGAADTHCDSSTGVVQYAVNGFVNVVQLFAVSRRQEESSKLGNLYLLFR
jgi:hypothetical protein